MQSYFLLLWIDGQFNFSDLIFAPVYVVIIFLLSIFFKPKSSHLRSYFFKGITLKIFGGILFWFVHCLLYKGGDSWAYFYSSKALGELLLFDLNSAWNIITEKVNATITQVRLMSS